MHTNVFYKACLLKKNYLKGLILNLNLVCEAMPNAVEMNGNANGSIIF